MSSYFDKDLIAKYNSGGPRYTSYPTALEFDAKFTHKEYGKVAEASNDSKHPLSLYFHIPYCDTLCYFCGCTKTITQNRTIIGNYVDVLCEEIALQAKLFDSKRPVQQLHWGGGTPTSLSNDEMTRIVDTIAEHFTLLDGDQGEYSIEIDPRGIDADKIRHIRNLGFNRMSLGVQDFNQDVQKAVNRLQSREETIAIIDAAKNYGFNSINLDLIYGLPLQNYDSFMHTLEGIVALEPNRLAVFNYAHLPSRIKSQRLIRQEDMPAPETKLAILEGTIDYLEEKGYIFIGMDHFAKPDDSLVRAQQQGVLYRNFQGYSTYSNCDLVGMGSSSIGMIGNSYSQNYKSVRDYRDAVQNDQIPIGQGYLLTADDLIRRKVITELICNWQLDLQAIEEQFGINFEIYFNDEIKRLATMQEDGLIEMKGRHWYIPDAGKLLIRHVCMVFDAHLTRHTSDRFSKVI